MVCACRYVLFLTFFPRGLALMSRVPAAKRAHTYHISDFMRIQEGHAFRG